MNVSFTVVKTTVETYQCDVQISRRTLLKHFDITSKELQEDLENCLTEYINEHFDELIEKNGLECLESNEEVNEFSELLDY